MGAGTVRWGILGTANIARAQFLPALAASGEGEAVAVAGRDLSRTEEYAQRHGAGRALQGYQALIDAGDVDAIYIALPNTLHAEWTIAALRAGKVVLCEKPLCVSVSETERVLQVVEETGGYLWEAFVFPFHDQMRRTGEILAAGDIGTVPEIQSDFHFFVRNRGNIRLRPELAGGALNDVGCYPVRLAQLTFADPASAGTVTVKWAPEGVDEEMQGIVTYGTDDRLLFSCGLQRPYDTYTRLLGNEGEIRLSNPYHPGPSDTLEIHRSGRVTIEHPTPDLPSFTRIVQHIHAVIHGEEAPRHLATDDSLATARTLEMLHRAAGSPPVEPVQ